MKFSLFWPQPSLEPKLRFLSVTLCQDQESYWNPLGSGDGSTLAYMYTWFYIVHVLVSSQSLHSPTILLAGTIIRFLNHAPVDIYIIRNPQLIKIGSLNSPSPVGHLIIVLDKRIIIIKGHYKKWKVFMFDKKV